MAERYRTRHARLVQEEAQGQVLSRLMEKCIQVKLCVSEEEPKGPPEEPVCLVRLLVDPEKFAELRDGASLDAGAAHEAFNRGIDLLNQLCTEALECHEAAMRLRKERARQPCASMSEIYKGAEEDLRKGARIPEIAREICALQPQLLSYAAQFTYVSNQILAEIEWCCFPPSMPVADAAVSTNDGARPQNQSDATKSE
jgi:hypothetical protein